MIEHRDSQEDRGIPAGLSGVQPGEFLLGCGVTDGEPLNFAELSSAFGFGNPVGEIVADLDQPRPFGQRHNEDGASNACVFVRATGSAGPTAVTEGNFAPLEVPHAARLRRLPQRKPLPAPPRAGAADPERLGRQPNVPLEDGTAPQTSLDSP